MGIAQQLKSYRSAVVAFAIAAAVGAAGQCISSTSSPAAGAAGKTGVQTCTSLAVSSHDCNSSRKYAGGSCMTRQPEHNSSKGWICQLLQHTTPAPAPYTTQPTAPDILGELLHPLPPHADLPSTVPVILCPFPCPPFHTSPSCDAPHPSPSVNLPPLLCSSTTSA